MPAYRNHIKHLSPRALAAIAKRMAERDQHVLLVEALSQSIERVIEQDVGVSLDRGEWELDLSEGTVTRKELVHANDAA